MARYERLDNIAHRDLRVRLRFDGPAVPAGLVPAFATEYAELQREYPLFLRLDEASGQYQCVALLGLESGENLFVREGRWQASYLPASVARGPFLIGVQEQWLDGAPAQVPVLHVDLEHPQASFSDGEPVFLPEGGHSPYLEQVIGVLRGIHDGNEAGPAMLAAFAAAGLIEPLRIELQLDPDHRINLAGLHGINRERLAALDPAALHGLHRAGYLEGAYLLLASQHNLRRLMAEKQRRLRQAAPVDAPDHAA